MSIYKFEEMTDDSAFLEVHFEGELRAGKDIESEEFQSLIKKIKKSSETKVVIIDISKLFFWDSEGMRKILTTLKDINQKQKNRAIVLGARSAKNFERAKEKYEVGTDEIPWFESKEEYLKSI